MSLFSCNSVFLPFFACHASNGLPRISSPQLPWRAFLSKCPAHVGFLLNPLHPFLLPLKLAVSQRPCGSDVGPFVASIGLKSRKPSRLCPDGLSDPGGVNTAFAKTQKPPVQVFRDLTAQIYIGSVAIPSRESSLSFTLLWTDLPNKIVALRYRPIPIRELVLNKQFPSCISESII